MRCFSSDSVVGDGFLAGHFFTQGMTCRWRGDDGLDGGRAASFNRGYDVGTGMDRHVSSSDYGKGQTSKKHGPEGTLPARRSFYERKDGSKSIDTEWETNGTSHKHEIRVKDGTSSYRTIVNGNIVREGQHKRPVTGPRKGFFTFK